MTLWSEFKKFAVKGNVIDLAVGVIIGTAFGKIVSSFVNDIFMPPIGVILQNVNLKNLKIPLSRDGSASLNYGSFFQNVVEFLIIAFIVFIFVKFINRFRARNEQEAAPKTIGREEELLAEIRDLLKNRPN